MADTCFKTDLKGLDKLIKDLSEKKEIEIGVLDDERSARIGASHEFGNPDTKLPMRSFLLAPMHEKQYLLQEVAQATIEETGDINKTYKELSIMAKSIVDDAFETGGYGKWEALSERTSKKNKKNIDRILIDTGQLRKSIKAKVVKL